MLILSNTRTHLSYNHQNFNILWVFLFISHFESRHRYGGQRNVFQYIIRSTLSIGAGFEARRGKMKIHQSIPNERFDHSTAYKRPENVISVLSLRLIVLRSDSRAPRPIPWRHKLKSHTRDRFTQFYVTQCEVLLTFGALVSSVFVTRLQTFAKPHSFTSFNHLCNFRFSENKYYLLDILRGR